MCEQFLENEKIQSQRITTLTKLDCYNKKLKQSNYSDEMLESKILTNIYLDRISEEEIKNVQLSEFDKTILLMACYEKHNKKKGIQIIKQKIKTDSDKSVIKIYNILLERLSSNRNQIFDVIIYANILKCHIVFDESFKYEEKKSDDEIVVQKNVEEPKILNEVNSTIRLPKSNNKNKKTYIIVKGENNNSRNSIKKSNTNFEKPTLSKEIKNEILIKDIFKDELMIISKYIYLELYNPERQKQAIKAWDVLERLSYSLVDDKKSLNKIITIIDKLFPEKIELNQKKYVKYLNGKM